MYGNDRPQLLLHSCCAPCASHVVEHLAPAFDVTVFFYNPNIYPEDEYNKRASWIRRLPRMLDLSDTVAVEEGAYEPDAFYGAVRGLEHLPEGAGRCRECFRLRMNVAASHAAKGGFDLFATTLSVSPHKDAGAINELGADLSREHGVEFLHADFKKRGGYQRSVELSKKLGIYRQRYCGCKFSLRQSKKNNTKEWT